MNRNDSTQVPGPRIRIVVIFFLIACICLLTLDMGGKGKRDVAHQADELRAYGAEG